jgi:hypothetical protein
MGVSLHLDALRCFTASLLRRVPGGWPSITAKVLVVNVIEASGRGGVGRVDVAAASIQPANLAERTVKHRLAIDIHHWIQMQAESLPKEPGDPTT